ncbi:MAG: hypothetical protein FJW81_05710 [Actinobacteria bacterium]|nr:hypothetical protein [Actinomycetota bacterium]
MSPRHRRLIQLVCALALLAGLGGIFALVAWSDQPQVRYASLRCIYREIYWERGPVDIVVVGTSRTKWGVSPETVSAFAAPDADPPAVVLNVSRSWRGTNQMLQQLVDVQAERGITKAIVVEYSREGDVVATSRRYYDYYPDHAAVVPVSTFREDHAFKPREPAYLLARDLLDLGQERVDYALDRLLTGKYEKNTVVPVDERPAGDSGGCTGKDRPLRQKHLDDWAARTTKRLGPWEGRDPVGYPFGAVNNDAQRESIRRIVAFGAEHGVAVFFVLMPRYYDSPTKQAYLDRFEREFGAPLLAPPEEVLRELNDGGYSDPNHLWEKGRLAYSEWLGGEIARRPGG